jgi:hypothetical protein
MEAYDVLVTAMASLIMLIVIHVAVFGVIRWMYPPYVQPQVRFVEPERPAPFTEPPQMKQEINVPTYAPPVSVAPPSEEGRAELGKAPSTAAERPAWLVAVDPKTLE